MNMTFEHVIVPLAKSCSQSLIEQVYVMNYIQETMNELQKPNIMSNELENYGLGAGTNE